MTWDVNQEFAVVVELLASASRSKGVDAFALSLLKAERQARRIFTFLVFQNSCFSTKDIVKLRVQLVKNEKFNFASAMAGIDLISPYPLAELCGANHCSLLSVLPVITQRRNKLFHGQLTKESLPTPDLEAMALTLKNWSISLAENGAKKLGYDGFVSGSFVKNTTPEFHRSLKRELTSVNDYSALIQESHKAGKTLIKT